MKTRRFFSVFFLLVLAASTVLNALYYLPSILAIWGRSDGEEGRQRTGRALGMSAACFLALNGVLGICIGPVSRLLEAGLAMLG